MLDLVFVVTVFLCIPLCVMEPYASQWIADKISTYRKSFDMEELEAQ